MKIRLMLGVAVFYLAVSCFFEPAFKVISDTFANYYLGSQFAVYQSNGKIMKMAISPVRQVRVLKDKILSRVLGIIKDMFYINAYKIMSVIIAVMLLFLVAYLFSLFFARHYDEICKKVDAMKKGDYAGILTASGNYPELSGKVNELSAKLEEDMKKSDVTKNEYEKNVNETIDQIQRMVSSAKGQLEVLLETGIIPEECQENIILNDVFGKICEAEDAIDQFKHS